MSDEFWSSILPVLSAAGIGFDCGIVETTCEQCGATCPVIVVPELPEDRHE